jgi:hypothetical protein
MKNPILFTLILAGLALGGCNSSTRSSNTAATDATMPPVVVDQSSTSTAANTNVDASAESSAWSQSSPSATTGAYSSPSSSASIPGDATYSSSSSASTSTPADSTYGTASSTPSYGGTIGTSSPATTGENTSGSLNSTASTSPTSSTPADSSTGVSSPGTNSIYSSSPATRSYPSEQDTTSSTTSPSTPAATSSPDISTRITEWRLGASELKSDLDRGVTIVRTKDTAVGAPAGSTDDELLETMVKGKFQADRETARGMIEVDAKNGEITLTGSADSAASLGCAMALALDTEGVTKVSSAVKVNSESRPQ